MNKKNISDIPLPIADDIILTIVVPAYNEEKVLPEFHKRVSRVINEIGMPTEILYINDGSTDQTLEIIKGFPSDTHIISYINLSRNFGKEIAMSAGLDFARGEAVILIDADLQDPPELMVELVKQWQEGYDNVYAQRLERAGEGFIKKATAHMFYRTIQKMTRIKIPEDTGDYRLLSRRAVEALKQFKEQHRFMKGLFAWIGYPQTAVPYKRDPRFAGETKWNYWHLWNFAIEGITSFSTAPLKISTYFGLLTALFAFFYGAFIIIKTLLYGDPVPGYPSLVVIVLFLGGVQLMSIGAIGEYLGRMFDETKKRPLYLVESYDSTFKPDPNP